MAPRAIDGKCRNNHKVAALSFRRRHQTADHQHEDVRGSRARRAALVLVQINWPRPIKVVGCPRRAVVRGIAPALPARP